MPKTAITALILDYGGVISTPQNQANVANMQALLDQDDGSKDFDTIYRKTRGGYDSGHLSAHDYWVTVFEQTGRPPTKATIEQLILEDVKSWTQINTDMLDFVRARKTGGSRLAIISNMTWETLAFMRKHFSWLELFDELVYSCELGISKPDIRIYTDCLERLQLPAEDCLFVDDSQENVEGARQAGMHAVHFTSQERFIEEIGENYIFV